MIIDNHMTCNFLEPIMNLNISRSLDVLIIKYPRYWDENHERLLLIDRLAAPQRAALMARRAAARRGRG